jgi:5-methylcytosine-specific restriction protein B
MQVAQDVLGEPERQTDYIAEWRLPGGLVLNLHRTGKGSATFLFAGESITRSGLLDLVGDEFVAGPSQKNSNHSAEIKRGPTMFVRVPPDRLTQFRRLLNDLKGGHAPLASTPPSGAPHPSESVSMATMSAPRNIILYGPPGTGKTYQTAALAVELCGEAVSEDRHALMAAYDRLVKDERIAFVTFHQSYGYEQFVEGLVPVTSSGEGESQTSAGFSLQPKAGIFKKMAQKAELSAQAGADLSKHVEALKTKRIFKMSLGRASDQGEVYERALNENIILLGWGGEEDWSDDKFVEYAEVLKRGKELDPGANGNSGDISQLWALRGNMREGDLVIVSDGNSRVRAIAEVTGPYKFQISPDGFNHSRTVKWLKVFDRPVEVDAIFDGQFTMRSLYQLDAKRLKFDALAGLLADDDTSGQSGTRLPHVLIIDEINRANVSKVFGELITLLEPDKRLGMANALRVSLPYSGEPFGVPANLHIVGTMNTADRSIALLDTALRRRFEFRELMPEPSRLTSVAGIDLKAVLTTLNDRIEYLFDRDHQIGHAFFMGCGTRSDIDQVMRQKVIPLLVEYFYEDWEKVRLVLGETSDDGGFVSRRALRRPGMLADEYEDDGRYRYQVRSVFAEDAYRQLG